MRKRKLKRVGLHLARATAFTIGIISYLFYRVGRFLSDKAEVVFDKADAALNPPKPPVRRIAVRQLGLATGQHIDVRRPLRTQIPVTYIPSE